MNTTVCRVCLVRDVKMHYVENTQLLQIYEKLSSFKHLTEDRMPKTVCFLCHSLLCKFWKFYNMAQKSEITLRSAIFNTALENSVHILTNIETTHNLSVRTAFSLDLPQNEQNPTLTEHTQDLNYICIYDTSVSVKEEVIVVKEEVSVKLESSDDYGLETDEDIVDVAKKKPFKSKESSGKKRKDYNCHKCSKKFIQSKNLQIHLRVHDNEKLFSCSLCNKNFLHRVYLKKHMQRHKEGPVNDSRPYCCDRCSKKFKESSHLKDHMRTHTGEKPFACNTCGRRFNQKGNLLLHLKIHNAEKTFACEICGRTFLLKCQLKSHYQLHSDEKPYSCNGCAMTFSYKSALKEHIRRIHSQVKAYACNLCGRSFDQECGLTRHMKIHSLTKAYSCKICNRSYKKAETLKRHMLIHNEENPYVCDRCNKAFKVLRYLQQHKRCSARCRNSNTEVPSLFDVEQSLQ